MKKSKLIISAVLALLVLAFASCSKGEDYEMGSGTASRDDSIVSNGLIEGGVIDDASDWGPVIGIK